MLRLLVTIGCLCAAAGAIAEPSRMSNASIKQLLAGSLLELDTPAGTRIPVRFSRDGLVSGKAGILAPVLGAARDRGRWWVADDHLCVKWFRWFEAKTRCVVLRLEGDQVFWRGTDGRSGTGVVAERAKPATVVARAPQASNARPAVSKDLAPAQPRRDERQRMQFATANAVGAAPANRFAAASPPSPPPTPSVPQVRAPAKPAKVQRREPSRPEPTAASSLVVRTSFRVAGVDPDDMLNVRSGPSEFSAAVGAIPPGGRGVRLTGRCLEDWCPIEHGRVRGWVNRYYLAVETFSGPSAARER